MDYFNDLTLIRTSKKPLHWLISFGCFEIEKNDFIKKFFVINTGNRFKYCAENCIKVFSTKFNRNKMKEIKDMHQEMLIKLLQYHMTLIQHHIVTLVHGCFSRFLNCTNGTKSTNAPHISL